MADHAFVREVLEPYRALVQPEVMRYLEPAAFQVDSITELRHPDIEAFHWQLCADYPLRGGKYLRPGLILLVVEGLGRPLEHAVKTAAAMEISQNWVLIHDDFEDDSLERRGKPALHRLHSPALAINAGDALHMIMWRILRDNERLLGAPKTLRVMEQFHNMLLRTCIGQTAELLFTQREEIDLTEDDYFYMVDGKTVYYSVAGPMRLGAWIVEDDPARLFPAVNQFGRALGRAFQIKDDLLDLTTTFKGQRGNDIVEGKRTLMLAHLLKHAAPSDARRVREIYRAFAQKRKSDSQDLAQVDEAGGWTWTPEAAADIETVLDLMRRCGSLDYSASLVDAYSDQAVAALDAMDFLTPGARHKLALGVDFNRTRQK